MKRDSRLSWFPFDPDKWLSISCLKGLSIPAQGVLIRLVCIQWIEDDIPSELGELTRKLGGFSDATVINEAIRLFVHRQGKVGKLYWPYLEALKHECIIRSNKLSAAGRKGALNRYHKRAVVSEDETELSRS